MVEFLNIRVLEDHESWVISNGQNGTQLVLENISIKNEILNEIYLVNTVFKNIYLQDCIIKSVDFSRADLRGAVFENIKFHNTQFCGSYLTNCSFVKCEITNCTFSGSNLESTTFKSCIIHKSDYSSSNLKNSDFSNAKISNSNFLNIQNSIDTIWDSAYIVNIITTEETLKNINNNKNEITIIGTTSIMNDDQEKILVQFNFPDDIKIACEQYIIYFSQFMADISLNVATNLKTQNNKTMFEVVPVNKSVALHTVYNNLSQYLGLPSLDLDNTFDSNNIELIRLKSELHSLKSKLLLAQAESTSLKNNMSSEINLIEYVEVVSDEKGNVSDKEFMIGEFLKIKSLKFPGIEINLPLFFEKVLKNDKK